MGLPGVATRQACWKNLAPLLGGAFSVISHALCNQASAAPLEFGGLVGQPPRSRSATSLMDVALLASPLIDVQIVHCATDCARPLWGLPPRGKPLLWKIALAPLRRGFFAVASGPLAACNQPCGATLKSVGGAAEEFLPETASPVGKQDCDPLSPATWRGFFCGPARAVQPAVFVGSLGRTCCCYWRTQRARRLPPHLYRALARDSLK